MRIRTASSVLALSGALAAMASGLYAQAPASPPLTRWLANTVPAAAGASR